MGVELITDLSAEPIRLELIKTTVKQEGFAFIDNGISEALLSRLQAECAEAKRSAKKAISETPLAYRSSLASLGPVGIGLLESETPSAILKPIFGKSFKYCADSSCYTYYEAGDFLSPHRDGADNCEVTLLFYISATEPGSDPQTSGLYLSLFTEDAFGRPILSKSIPTPMGGIMVGRGSETVHGRDELAPGEHIWMLTACFTAI